MRAATRAFPLMSDFYKSACPVGESSLVSVVTYRSCLVALREAISRPDYDQALSGCAFDGRRPVGNLGRGRNVNVPG